MYYMPLLICSAGYHLYVLLIVLLRIYNVRMVDDEVLDKESKDKYSKTLCTYIGQIFACSLINFLCFPFSKTVAVLTFPIIAVVILAKLHGTVIDEIEAYNLNHKNIERMVAFKKEVKNDVAKKNLEYEAFLNKINSSVNIDQD